MTHLSGSVTELLEDHIAVTLHCRPRRTVFLCDLSRREFERLHFRDGFFPLRGDAHPTPKSLREVLRVYLRLMIDPLYRVGNGLRRCVVLGSIPQILKPVAEFVPEPSAEHALKVPALEI